MVISVGIDVSKDKHDCFIVTSEGEVLADVFTIPNTMDLRYALFNATKYVCHWNPAFADYLAKKRAEGKHYYIAISHAAKKLVRLIFAMEKSRTPYLLAT